MYKISVGSVQLSKTHLKVEFLFYLYLHSQNLKKLYPQHSSTWCEEVEESYKMPTIVKAKEKPNLHRAKSVVQVTD